ncbi:MAG: D-alanyl-D-alanine carboxypeptidase precursor [Bacteroidetes bacterium ADurb.Bin139]|jgi:CubicO group peptidase (beta-lactamase class C family)|nr:MAG: D-alanyl-D-alanine carboxypeptidase precursor [Bacteroidetes bacterium ADurb.Bin139]HOZ19722.1 serine hydrolase domain-containing protein [Bacteroidales bacterium]HPB78400.1 serine hydrolase domain-containing protein [Bacteroidales bacterium]HQN82537.1 serine hydrolase domain-containing protein [Bacteroidales bacterium]
MNTKPFIAILLIAVISSCTPDYHDKIFDIAREAGIPLIQVAYSKGNAHVGYEISTVPEITPRKDNNTVFQAASLSKTVFAYIVMRMSDRGEIDLDRPLAEYADIERFDDKKLARRLTARMVLSHRTGLPNWAVSPGSPEWPEAPIVFKFRPDSAFSYSGEGYAFLQRAVEQIQGKRLEEIAQHEVFLPLGMGSSSYAWRDDYDTLAVNGFNRDGEDRGKGNFPRANAAYTLRTTAEDYIKFLEALSQGNGFGPKSREAMFHSEVQAVRYAERPRECDAHIFWGLGLGIEKHPELGEVAFHWGDNGAFRSLFLIVPKRGLQPKRILVYFTNSQAGHDIIHEISSLFLENREPLAIHEWVNKIEKTE